MDSSYECGCSGDSDSICRSDTESQDMEVLSQTVLESVHQNPEVDSAMNEMEDVDMATTQEEEKKIDVKNLNFIDISPDRDCGVLKHTFRGSDDLETPGYGDRVTAYCKAHVMKGSDYSSIGVDHGTFVVGKGPIRGIDIAVSTMKTNEYSAFLCQPAYAFGAVGKPPDIPPDATILFEITLLSWSHEDLSVKKDGGILRKSIIKPTGSLSPNDGAVVKVDITGYYNDEVFEDKSSFEFYIGEGCKYAIPEGIEIALLKFKIGEKSRLYITCKYAFGAEGHPVKRIPPNALLVYDVTLLNFVKAKEIWEMNTDDKWHYSVQAKQRGRALYEAGHLKAALKQYKKIIKYLEDEPGVAQEEVQRRADLLLTGYLNAALCLLKLKNPMEAVKVCDKAIMIDPVNEKALFRRGQAKFLINDFSEAQRDFEKILLHYPYNKAAKNYIAVCQARDGQVKRKEQMTYGNMFKKFADEDEERRKQRKQQTETGIWVGQEHSGESASAHSSDDDDPIVQMLNKQNLCMTRKDPSGN